MVASDQPPSPFPTLLLQCPRPLAAALGGELESIRDKPAFDALVAKIGRELFAEAMQRLQLAEFDTARDWKRTLL